MLTIPLREDTTTQMIETIWPLSDLSCSRDPVSSVRQQSLIGLRTFVHEVLRRSKTSYSTLQVALYYLILIQSCLPKHDLTMEQSEDSPACRAMQCGRRMFLAALILASKYLQDKNYSTRAWGKISGLKTCEINANEMAFLKAVKWKLHIPEPTFTRWTNIVLSYSPSARFHGSPRSAPIASKSWKSIVPKLTPELDTIPISPIEHGENSGYDSAGSKLFDMCPPPVPVRAEISPCPGFRDATPKNTVRTPRTIEPTPRDTKANENTLPPLPRLGLLPTPQMTPQTSAFCTPAVSASGLGCGRSMSHAMAIQSNCIAKANLDNPAQWQPDAPKWTPLPTPSTVSRTSTMKLASLASSPESMISDTSSRSTRSSRSSSISSMASSHCALSITRAALAVQATKRCANMQLHGLKEEHGQGGLDVDDPMSWMNYHNSKPLPWSDAEAGHSTAFYEPFGHIPNDNPNHNTREAASALRDLRLNHQQTAPPPPTPIARPQKQNKRARPNSMDLSVQSCVRDLVAPRCLGDITNRPNQRNAKDRIVLPDPKPADSFLLPGSNKKENSRPSSSHGNSTKPALSAECLPRKKTCAGSDRGGRAEARLMLQKCKENMEKAVRGPGLWGEVV